MQPRLGVRQWALFVLVNIVISALTALIVVRSLTQLFSQPVASLAAPAVEATAPPPTEAVASPPAADANAPAALPTAIELPSPTVPAVSTVQPRATAAPPAVATAPASGVTISAIVFPGQRNREMVVLVNQGDAADLTGWTLSNPRGKTYTFGAVVLPRDSYINLHTKRGLDVPTDLFWNADEAIWQSGDTAVLKRGEEVIASYTVP